jgi:LysM repeat protein
LRWKFIVRISALLFCAALCLAAPSGLRAQNPGAAQDAEAAREKLLKASDELDNIQANSEQTRAAVDTMKTDAATMQQNITALQNENAALKQQLADLQASFDQYKAEQAKQRQQLIANVADMIAAGTAKSARKKKSGDTADSPAPETAPNPEMHTAPDLAPPPDSGTAADDPPPAPKKQRGYFHVVAPGETVPLIAEAYRDQGVKVTAAQIRRANGLTPDSELKAGQKLFIPKPGT